MRNLRVLSLLTFLLAVIYFDATESVASKCPGKAAKSCPSGQACVRTQSKDGKKHSRCVAPKPSCKAAGATPVKIVFESGKNWLVCKAGAGGAKPTDPPGDAVTEAPGEPPVSDASEAPVGGETSAEAASETTVAPTSPGEPEATSASPATPDVTTAGACPAGDTYTDAKDLCYPSMCKKLPAPEMNFFNTLSDPFPCFKLTKAVFGEVKGKQDAEPTTPGKCAWDYVVSCKPLIAQSFNPSNCGLFLRRYAS